MHVALLICLLAVYPDRAAQAYIDPNTGGWLFQLLFPLLVAITAGWSYLRRAVTLGVDVVLRRLGIRRNR